MTVAKRERDAQLRELTDQAHGANLDLGHALIHNLASVDPADIDVARFFVYALLGADHDSSPYTQTGERIARIAAGGMRLVVDELRSRRHQDPQGRQPRPAARSTTATTATRRPRIAWLWKFIDGAKTAGELYGRALVVIAAEQHATRLVVPSSQRMPATRWSSHKDIAAKALKKLAGPHVPASLTQARAGRQARPRRLRQGRGRRPASSSAPSASRPSPRPDDGIGDELDEDLDDAA